MYRTLAIAVPVAVAAILLWAWLSHDAEDPSLTAPTTDIPPASRPGSSREIDSGDSTVDRTGPALRTPSTAEPVTATVRVLGPEGHPLPGLTVRIQRRGHSVAQERTDRLGEVRIDKTPLNGSTRVELHPQDQFESWRTSTGEPVRAAVTRRVVTVHSTAGLPVLLQPFDTISGQDVPGVRWKFVAQSGKPRLASEGPQTQWSWIYGASSQSLRIIPPPGYVVWDRTQKLVTTRTVELIGPTLIPTAAHYVLRYPLRPEARIVLRGTPQDRGRTVSLVVCGFSVGGDSRTRAVAELEAHGSATVPGVPFFPGGTVRLLVVSRGVAVDLVNVEPNQPEGTARMEIELLGDEEGRLLIPGAAVVELHLPRDPLTRVEHSFDWGELRASKPVPWDTSEGCPGNKLPFQESFGDWESSTPRPRSSGEVAVLVQNRSGDAVAGARVLLAGDVRRTGPDGWARFSPVPAGSQRAVVTGADFVKTTRDVEVRPGELQRVTVIEAEGCTLVLHVEDEQGNRLSYAHVELRRANSGRPIVWLDRGRREQRIDSFTDAGGSRTYARLDPGETEVAATWGRWDGEITVDLQPATTREVTVVLRERK